MGMLKNIEWSDDSRNTIVFRYDMKNDYVSKGSALTVRESQNAIFCHKGKMADVFLPGFYKLDTNSVPVLTKLMSWKYGFENIFRSDIYFVNTKQFINQKWGTKNPIILRDKDYGAVRIRAFGTFAFRVDDAFIFMQELSGTGKSYATADIVEYLKSMIIRELTDALGESKIPILDMAGNVSELGEIVKNKMQPDFKKMGIEIVQFNFENFSMPEELEKALDRSASLGIARGTMDIEMQRAQQEALVNASKNPGAGTYMAPGMGLGMGMGMGQMYSGMMKETMQPQSAVTGEKCAKCGASLKKGAKFCPDCGQATGFTCKCGAAIPANAKFCPECGVATQSTCPKCGKKLSPGAKFCPECGGKV